MMVESELSGIADILWAVFAFCCLYIAYSNRHMLKRLVIDWGNKQLLIDIKEEVATAQAKLAQDAASVDTEERGSESDDRIILWAVGNQRGAVSARNALESLDYKIKDASLATIAQEIESQRDKVALVVTNLKHGDDYHAGSKIATSVRQSVRENVPLVLFTSQSALERRKVAIDEIAPDAKVTNIDELVTTVVRELAIGENHEPDALQD